MQFILVEDDEIAAHGITLALEAYGHQVVVVRSSARLFAILAEGDPDALILDITLHGDDGVMISRAVRARWRTLPIVFTTGHESYAGLADALRDPKTRLLRKPYEIATLIAMAREMLRNPDQQRVEGPPGGV